MHSAGEFDSIVIGGGFFGCSIACHLAEGGERVLLLETSAEVMSRASYHNQARIHNGYHYPRSLLTALRSRLNFPRFVESYKDAVVGDFTKIYAIPRMLSKVSARQFEKFCQRIGAPIQQASSPLRRLFNSDLVEDVFETVEYAFDALKLADITRRKMANAGVHLRVNTAATALIRLENGRIGVQYGEGDHFSANKVLNCTYSELNSFSDSLGGEISALKHELTEIALVEVPPELKQLGITLMCGPFFSCMPFPATNQHSLSHVRYTPHAAWLDSTERRHRIKAILANPPLSKAALMIADASRFIPLLRETELKQSLWEVKTVLAQSELDDSRPILFRRHFKMPGVYSVLGGKIDNIFDCLDELEKQKEDTSCLPGQTS